MFTVRYEVNFTLVVEINIYSPRSPGFDRRPLHRKCLVDRALGNIAVTTLQFSPVSIIAPMLHTHLHLNTALTRRTSGLSLGTFKLNNAVSNVGIALDRQSHLHCCSLAVLCNQCYKTVFMSLSGIVLAGTLHTL